jgi:hypothetical protein
MPDSPLRRGKLNLLLREWHWKAYLPRCTEAHCSPLYLTAGEFPLPHQRARMLRFPTEGKKAVT